MADQDEATTQDIETIAARLLSVLGTGRQIPPLSEAGARVDLAASYRVTAAVRRMREARGEVPVGRKIGFTNRTIWAEYGVFAPIWGYVYAHTVHDLAATGASFGLAGLAEPRIEPEIVFGLAKAPTPDMDEEALLACIGWVAHGFEIVQSIFRKWIFAAPDTVAAFGLHGALLVGVRHKVAPRGEAWLRTLSAFEIDLLRDGIVVDHGLAANVLDGPLSALRHLVGLLAQDPANPPLAAGEIVTTGTLTRAFPVLPGERWETRLSGIGLDPLAVRFA
ncbi:MAG: 2-keto-4-pentenoate hydratase [Hyphomicrobiales bacterium]